MNEMNSTDKTNKDAKKRNILTEFSLNMNIKDKFYHLNVSLSIEKVIKLKA